MDRARRILSGGWLSTAVSHFTRGWYEESAGLPPPIVTAPVCLDLEDRRLYDLFLQNETVTDLELSNESAYHLDISDENCQ